jgi:hypothetical protein
LVSHLLHGEYEHSERYSVSASRPGVLCRDWKNDSDLSHVAVHRGRVLLGRRESTEVNVAKPLRALRKTSCYQRRAAGASQLAEIDQHGQGRLVFELRGDVSEKGEGSLGAQAGGINLNSHRQERLVGVEPTCRVWEARAWPLGQRRLVDRTSPHVRAGSGIRTPVTWLEARGLAAGPIPQRSREQSGRRGSRTLKARRSPDFKSGAVARRLALPNSRLIRPNGPQ